MKSKTLARESTLQVSIAFLLTIEDASGLTMVTDTQVVAFAVSGSAGLTSNNPISHFTIEVNKQLR
jgi:hypothetical protein